MKQFCIVIPIYKKDLSIIEQISLRRLYTVLGNKYYDVYFVYPQRMSIKAYIEIFPTAKSISFDKSYFESTATYSQLLISYDFYNTFSEYEYMQIYQLDAYIIEDKIEEWCNKGYDYVGATVLSQDCGWPNTPRIGNGGVSLRKVETFKYVTDPDGEFIKMYSEFSPENTKNVKNEDVYFCVLVNKKYGFDFCPVREGLAYCIDMNPDLVLDKYKYPQPLFIHAIDRNIRYWRTKIKELNTDEIVSYCEDKYKDFFSLYYWKNDGSYCTILEENDNPNNIKERIKNNEINNVINL